MKKCFLTICLILCPGCGKKPDDTIEGTYNGLLIRDANLNENVEIARDNSELTAKLWKNRDGELSGTLIFNGDIYIGIINIWDYGDDPYPVKNINFDRLTRELDGSVKTPFPYPNIGFTATFPKRFEYMDIHTDLLGDMRLWKLIPVDSGDSGGE